MDTELKTNKDGLPVMLGDHCWTIQGITCWCGIQHYQAALGAQTLQKEMRWCTPWDLITVEAEEKIHEF